MDLTRAHPRRVRLRPARHHDRHAGREVLEAAPRRVPGLRPPADRLPALAGPGRPLRQRLPADPPAARPPAPGRRRRLARLDLRSICPTSAGSTSIPTNDLMPGEQHVILACGRDFADVTPVRGVILGGGHHELRVEVDVTADRAVVKAAMVLAGALALACSKH